MALSCFKAYDIRGKVPEQLSADLAYDIAVAFAAELEPSKVVVGYDIRLESPEIAASVRRGLLDAGVDVIDIGLCGTEEVYFNTPYLNADGGIMITASHNPKGYNGLKMVREGSRPISGDTGLKAIEHRVETGNLPTASIKGTESSFLDKTPYIEHLLTYIRPESWNRMKLVFNAGNGSAGAVIEQLTARLNVEPTFVHLEPNGDFPNGVPNPLLVENRESTSRAVIETGADFGVAWDGDFDRCFFFDKEGTFIEGYYVVGLLAASILNQHAGSKIIHDPRLTWNTIDIVKAKGGVPIQSKTGHAFIKEIMREQDAVYGGEMSAHHYFRDFNYCDSGMIPWLLVGQLLVDTGKTLAELVAERIAMYPCSGEVNFRVEDIHRTIALVENYYVNDCIEIDRTDGVSLSFTDWRMNIRASNTEPLLRVNIESKDSTRLVSERLSEVSGLIKGTL